MPNTRTQFPSFWAPWNFGAGVLALGLSLACGGSGAPSSSSPSAPSALVYASNPASYTKGVPISPNVPTSQGGAVESYSVSPPLPAGLTLTTGTGIISGTPTEFKAAANYIVTAANRGGSTSASVNITVHDLTPAITSFTAAPSPVTAGDDVVLSYEFANGTGQIDSGVGVVTTGGSTHVNPTSSTTYTLTVTNGTGDHATAQAAVTVVAAPAISTFSASVSPVDPGNTSYLSVAFTGGTGLITPGNLSVNSGDAVPVNPVDTTLYTLTVTNSLGAKATKTLTVEVNAINGLALNILGLPTGIDAAVLVTGPNGFSQPLTTSTTLPNLAPGTYTITASTVVDPGHPPLGLALSPWPGGLAYHPYQPSQTVEVAPVGTSTITVKYPPPTLAISIPDVTQPGSSVLMDFVLVPAGTFRMGAPEGGLDGATLNPYPVHTVTFDRAFYLAKTPCTQAQWKAVMGNNPSEYSSANTAGLADDFSRPVESVSWDNIRTSTLSPAYTCFLDQLAAATGHQYAFTLPSEAQWEYACRAGTTTAYFFGDTADNLATYAVTSTTVTLPVASKLPNPWGLYDMVGNVYVWMEDDAIHASGTVYGYTGAPTDGRAWLENPRVLTRVVRGGGQSSNVNWYRSAIRYLADPAVFTSGAGTGLRLALAVP